MLGYELKLREPIDIRAEISAKLNSNNTAVYKYGKEELDTMKMGFR